MSKVLKYQYFVLYLIKKTEDFSRSGIKDQIKNLGSPYFIKVDDGYNSLGLNDSCVTDSVDKIIEKAKEMISQYGPVLIQHFLGGREFTIAVDNDRAYHPVERVFETGQLISPANGTKTERVVPDHEEKLIREIQNAAFSAYKAVEGSCYGRVDLRQDSITGKVYVLEVNNTCSMADDSYFEISSSKMGYSKINILDNIIKGIGKKQGVTKLKKSSQVIN